LERKNQRSSFLVRFSRGGGIPFFFLIIWWLSKDFFSQKYFLNMIKFHHNFF
jgi:hypothetical protein